MGRRNVVLVEGKDDEHVIKHLCGNRAAAVILEFQGHQSVEDLLASIPVRLKASYDGDIVGIVLDADVSLANRWVAVRNQLVALKYPNVPELAVPTGMIVDPPESVLLPRVGVWLMPDNLLNGMLEDFLALLVPSDSTLFARVKRTIDEIPADEQLFSTAIYSKAVIHTWLAWQKDPGLPFGTAITARFLDPMKPEADAFLAWIRTLYCI